MHQFVRQNTQKIKKLKKTIAKHTGFDIITINEV